MVNAAIVWVSCVAGVSLFTAIIIRISLRRNPWRCARSAFFSAVRVKWLRRYLLVFLSLLVAHAALVYVQNSSSVDFSAIGFGAAVSELEAPFHVWLHGMHSRTVEIVCLVVYFGLFPATILSSVIIYDSAAMATQLSHFFRAQILCLAGGLVLLALIDLPEVWLMLDLPSASPNVEPGRSMFLSLRLLSGKANCLPSMHCALVSIPYFVSRHTSLTSLRRVNLIGAAAVWFSTVYTGIHWLVDVVAGVLYAWLSVVIVCRIAFPPDRVYQEMATPEARAKARFETW